MKKVLFFILMISGYACSAQAGNKLYPKDLYSFRNGISIEYDVIRSYNDHAKFLDTVMIRAAKFISKGDNTYTDNSGCEYISKGEKYLSRDKRLPIVYFSDSLTYPISRVTYPIYDLEKIFAILDTINDSSIHMTAAKDTATFVIPVRDIVGNFDTLYLVYIKDRLVSIKERAVNNNLVIDDLIRISSIVPVNKKNAETAFNRMEILLNDPEIKMEIKEYSKVYNSIIKALE